MIKKLNRLLLLLCLAVFVLHQFYFALGKSSAYLKILAQNHWDYLNIRKAMPGSAIGLGVKKIVPRQAVVTFSDEEWDINRVAVRYEIYPIIIAPRGCFLLDMHGSFSAPIDWQKRELPSQAVIYAKPGCWFTASGKNETSLPFPLVLFFAGSFALFSILTGYLFLKTLSVSAQDCPKTWILGTSYLAGQILLTCSTWLYLILGGSLNRTSVMTLWLVVFLGLFWASRKKSFSCPKTEIQAQDGVLNFILSILSVILVSAIFLTIVSVPVKDWDAMSHWLLKSKVMFHQQNLDLRYTHNNYYPLLWPLSIAAQYALSGGTFDELAKWSSGFLFLAFISQLAGALAFLKVRKSFIPLFIILFLTAFFHDPLKDRWTVHFQDGNAENIFLAALTATLASLLLWLNHREQIKWLAVAGLMALGLCSAKLEGAPALLFSIASLGFLSKPLKLTRPELTKLAMLLGIIIIPLAWIGYSKVHGFHTNISHLTSLPSVTQISALFNAVTTQLRNSATPLVIAWAMLFLFLFPNPRKWDSREKFLLMTGIAMTLFVLLAFAGWTTEKINADFGDVAARLFLHSLCPLGLFWASRMFSRQTPGQNSDQG